MADLYAGVTSSNARPMGVLAPVSGEPIALFSGNSFLTGRELWRAPLPFARLFDDQLIIEARQGQTSVERVGTSLRVTGAAGMLSFPIGAVSGIRFLGDVADHLLTLSGLSDIGVRIEPGRGRTRVQIPDGAIHLSTAGPFGKVQLEVSGTAQVELGKTTAVSELILSGSAQVALADAVAKHLKVSSLSVAEGTTLDLRDGELLLLRDDVETSLRSIAPLVAAGRKNGSWSGAGISSSLARGDLSRLTGLAVVTRPDGILIRYTWNGDANVDGRLDIDDYVLIDSGFLRKARRYQDGDFNFDQVIDLQDYFLIDLAYAGQSGVPWL